MLRHGAVWAHGTEECVLKGPSCIGKSGLPSARSCSLLNKSLVPLSQYVPLGSDSRTAPPHLSDGQPGLTHRHGLEETGTRSARNGPF